MTGESADSKHKGEIEVVSWSWGLQAPVEISTGQAFGVTHHVTSDCESVSDRLARAGLRRHQKIAADGLGREHSRLDRRCVMIVALGQSTGLVALVAMMVHDREPPQRFGLGARVVREAGDVGRFPKAADGLVHLAVPLVPLGLLQ